MHLTVHGGCRRCARALSLPAGDFRLLRVNGRTTFSFTCPLCGAFDVRIAGTVDLVTFTRQGLDALRVELSPTLIGGQPPTGEVITEDDLLVFGQALESTS